MAGEVIHDDDVAGLQDRSEELLDVSDEDFSVDRTVECQRRDHAVHPQSRYEGRRLAVAVGHALAQALAPGATAMRPRHVGCGPGLVDEDEPFRLQIHLVIEPVMSLAQDIGPVLLDRVTSLFLRVMP